MLGRPVDKNHPTVRKITTLQEARGISSAGPRLDALRAAAERLRGQLLDADAAVCVRTLPLTTLLYPARYAFWGAALSPAPFVQLTHRCLLVQARTDEGVKTLLWNPTDYVAARKTPFFAQLIKMTGEWIAEHLLSTAYGTVVEHLGRLGVRPDQVDYVAFDHLHTQDLRPLLGTTGPEGRPPLYPNAQLLIQRAEWDEAAHPHPLQAAWFVAGTVDGVRTGKVVMLEGDVSLGAGLALVSTPGHTAGNQSLVVRTERGLWVSSENGVASEAWSPLESRIPGLRAYSRRMRLEVILNANTVEGGTDQYTSMVIERTLADPVKDAPGFFQVFPSSELTASPLAPGLAPTHTVGELTSGALVRDAIRDTAHTATSSAN
jgi:glyoxylase-like metal-dependent hydrolase (beta-lactamase superfamily II)